MCIRRPWVCPSGIIVSVLKVSVWVRYRARESEERQKRVGAPLQQHASGVGLKQGQTFYQNLWVIVQRTWYDIFWLFSASENSRSYLQIRHTISKSFVYLSETFTFRIANKTGSREFPISSRVGNMATDISWANRRPSCKCILHVCMLYH